MHIERLSDKSDIRTIVTSLIPDEWDELNCFTKLDIASLEKIAKDESYFFLLAYIDQKIVGTSLAILLNKPDGSCWLYIDEIDTHPQYRRQGVAKALMQELFQYAKNAGASEAWLGADTSNEGANAFYKSLAPSEITEVRGYTFTMDECHEYQNKMSERIGTE